MRLVCHAIIPGPFITRDAGAFGGPNVQAHEGLMSQISERCAEVRNERWKSHRLLGRYDFYLHGRRLVQNDVDNMVKQLHDAAFGVGGGPVLGDAWVWRVEGTKIAVGAEDDQRTVIWFFDLGRWSG